MKQSLQVVLSLYLAMACSLASAASVVCLSPGKSTEAYWLSYAQFMQAAAKDAKKEVAKDAPKDPKKEAAKEPKKEVAKVAPPKEAAKPAEQAAA